MTSTLKNLKNFCIQYWLRKEANWFRGETNWFGGEADWFRREASWFRGEANCFFFFLCGHNGPPPAAKMVSQGS